MFKDIFVLLFDLNPKKIIVLIIIIICLLLFFPFIDTKIIQPLTLSKQINNLDTLVKMDITVINQNPTLENIYNSILEKLEDSNSNLIAKRTIPIWKKFVFGGAAGWLMIIILPFAKYNNLKTKILSLIVLIIIGSLLGGIGILIPDFEIKEINLYLYPGLQLVLLFLIAYLRLSKSTKSH